MRAMSPLSKYRYTRMFIIFFLLLHFSQPIFSGRILDGSPAALPAPKDGVNHVGMVFMPSYNPYRWPGELPMTLKYAFLQENPVAYLSQTEVDSAFARAFATWSAVIPVSFEKTNNLSLADVTIGFFRRDHGDGIPFDGMNGALAHTMTPPAGIMHFDADERWAVDFHKDKSKHAFHLQSVVTHEIGHLLGLGHIEIKGAIMYPSIHARTTNVDLTIDDVYMIQGLYGPDPNFDPRSLHVPSSGCSILMESRTSLGRFTVLMAGMIIMIL